jgi:hypothetical protein
LEAQQPRHLVWTSLWPDRPNDQIRIELAATGGETSLRFVLLTPDQAPGDEKTRDLRRRLSHLLFADLRYSYGE